MICLGTLSKIFFHLECLSSLLEQGGSVCLYEKGDYQTIPRHPDFRYGLLSTNMNCAL